MTQRRGAAVLSIVAGVAFAAHAVDTAGITAFSAMDPAQPIPPSWYEIKLTRLKPPEFTLVRDDGATVLRSNADSAGGSLVHRVDVDPKGKPRLAWRWKIDHVVEGGDLTRPEGDDYAARVYVMFDLPLSELPLGLRTKVRLARLLHSDVPSAAICYVWDNRQPVGTIRPNTHVGNVRMIVLRSGPEGAGKWAAESRDLDADFRAAFAGVTTQPTPRIVGVAVGNDTDQTHGSVTAWFGDLRIEAAR
ncbi:hypothetical protein DSM104443_03917 [Usitatibacter rugosus]|uniref:DUF3047 domain-containing protein n=1 Tax=Usitatibacter rugosus TaxID=2732067 RepID=A0A6M4H2K7_9PROT|nr:DUF3047 domain-containing protein [Usitatibacter rugosus]QJR12824.1 hypothetical protein DSM104443_03917 [Usitatibacter rugosus]